MFKGERRRNPNGLGRSRDRRRLGLQVVFPHEEFVRWSSTRRSRRTPDEEGPGECMGRSATTNPWDLPNRKAERQRCLDLDGKIADSDAPRRDSEFGLAASGWCTGRTAASRSRADSLKELEALDSETRTRRRPTVEP
jgi:hypothetical protein